MFERFTERARQVIVLAQDEARQMKHNYIGVEHLLLGLIREEEGLAAKVLYELGLKRDVVRKQVALNIDLGDESVAGQIPFTPRARKVLELALREALSLGHNYIGTEHILLAMVRETEGAAAKILTDAGVTADQIRDEVIRILSGPRRSAGVASEAQTKERKMTDSLHHAKYVWFNDGTNESVYALVIKKNSDGTLNLLTVPESGVPDVKNGIPQREVSDYGAEGGGYTWHL